MGKVNFRSRIFSFGQQVFPKRTNSTSLVGIDAETAGTAKTTFGRERLEGDDGGGAPLIKRDKHQTAD